MDIETAKSQPLVPAAEIEEKPHASQQLPIGSKDYRAFVGPPEKYDLIGAMQFNLLTALGLREHHYLLDIGCGSLRAGRLFIPYLLPEHYYAIEPEVWLVQEGIERELGHDIQRAKRPVFSHDRDFNLSAFRRRFDFILAQSIFSHASGNQIRSCLAGARRMMGQTSIFAATFFEGQSNYTGDGWVYPGCVTYKWEKMAELGRQQGLICKPVPWPHPNGQKWLGFVLEGHVGSFPNLSWVWSADTDKPSA
jgi:hypothetical protein